jgi:phosphoglycolate phosphatase-like HAD superfamily hydrolase
MAQPQSSEQVAAQRRTTLASIAAAGLLVVLKLGVGVITGSRGPPGRESEAPVATSKPLALAEPLLASLDLRHRFELIAAPDLDAHREDKAATIRGALSTLQTARAVMIGDRLFDIIGAHACAIQQ